MIIRRAVEILSVDEPLRFLRHGLAFRGETGRCFGRCRTQTLSGEIRRRNYRTEHVRHAAGGKMGVCRCFSPIEKYRPIGGMTSEKEVVGDDLRDWSTEEKNGCQIRSTMDVVVED